MQPHAPIRVATIGYDAAVARLIDAAERSRRFQLTAQFDREMAAPQVASQPPVADTARSVEGVERGFSSWEALLDDHLADLVIVAARPHDSASADRRAEQLKRLVQVGMPLILVHPACDMLLAYELDMHRQDEKGPIYPYCPAADHPVIPALASAIGSGQTPWGHVEQLVCERTATAAQRDKLSVLDLLARDALLIGRLMGDVSSVAATGVSPEAPGWGNLGIHFAGPAQLMARWSLGPQPNAAGIRVTMIGSTTIASLWLPDAEGNADIDPPADGFPPPMLAGQTADDFLRRVAEAEGEPDKWRGVSWEEVCRSLEVTDAVQRSAARRRTIELHHEPVTEQETFKSMMAAGGCGMLIWVLLCLLVVGMVEGLKIPIRETAIWQLWPAVMFAPLAVFLALQLLQLVFPRKSLERRAEGGELRAESLERRAESRSLRAEGEEKRS